MARPGETIGPSNPSGGIHAGNLNSGDSNSGDCNSGNLDGRGASSPDGSPGRRGHLRWWLGASLVVLVLALLPPLINANRYQRQIARSMSLSLGRPVHLDNVSFHLLPVPGFTLRNLVVSEEPAFGAEPTIRANTVEASLRLSSLWRRRVEFSTVRFVEPSVNLVRNTEGRWNLGDVLLHAAHVNTAPTAQRRAGSAPRLPYIEATGGRVNVKLGDQKLPFSFTGADFALWQPSPHQWRVRLRGQPDRTDVNMTDPGSLRIEGDLLQATAAEDVHVNLHADWYDAPLGEATLLLTGGDMGWRGDVNWEASLAGTPDAAQFRSKLTLGGLRRADFAPAHPLDLQGTCTAGFSLKTVQLKQLACSLPDGAPEPIGLRAPDLDLQHPERTEAELTATAVPNRWALLWAALFSPGISSETAVPGTLDLQFTRLGAPGKVVPVSAHAAVYTGASGSKAAGSGAAASGAADSQAFGSGKTRRHADFTGAELSTRGSGASRSAWRGSVTVHFPAVDSLAAGAVAGDPFPSATLVFRSVFDEPSPASDPSGRTLFRLDPTPLHPDAASTLRVDGELSTGGYMFDVAGIADKAALLAPAHFLPELGEGVDAVITPLTAALLPASGDATPVDFTCNAVWGAEQICVPHSILPAPKSRTGAGVRSGSGARGSASRSR